VSTGIQKTTITFEIITQASEPLVIEEYVKQYLLDEFEAVASRNLNLEYHPEGNRFQTDRHKLIGIGIVE